MNIIAIKTAESEVAVNRIKSMIKKEVFDVQTNVPKEFIEKRQYMQSDEFIKDEHNATILKLGETLGELREKICQEIAEKNKTAKDIIVQGINGFSRIKKYLDANIEMNFSDIQTFHSATENKYAILKKYKIGNAARKVKNQLGIK